ncbi:IS3 family transposase [Pseudomonas sp. MPFS]|nr:IS3 family transposase [Pseudomonas sp. MPFS]
MKFRAIEALAGRYPVAPMCRLLRVSRSGFYAWQQRPPSAREMANRRLSKEIRTIHHEMNGIYGHRRIKAELAAMGHACGRHRVARLMREAGLRVRSRKRWRLVSSSRHALPIAPNHLDRQFASDRANRHWVSDMTYVRTAQGWLYLAVVLTSHRRLGDAPPHAAGLGTRRAGDGHCTPAAERRSAAALGSRQPILRVRLPGLTSATSNRTQPFTSRELLGQRRDGELLPFAEG